MNKNTFLSIIIAGSVVFAFTGCSSAEESLESNEPTALETLATAPTTESSPNPTTPQTAEPNEANGAVETPPLTEPPTEPQLDPAELIENNPVEIPEETAGILELKKALVQVNALTEYSKIALMRTQGKKVREYAAINIEKTEKQKTTLEEQIKELGFNPAIANPPQDNSYETIILLMDVSDEEFDATFVEVMLEQEKQVQKTLKKILDDSATLEEKQQLDEPLQKLITGHNKNITELNSLQNSL